MKCESKTKKKDKLANLFKLVRVHLLRVHYGILIMCGICYYIFTSLNICRERIRNANWKLQYSNFLVKSMNL